MKKERVKKAKGRTDENRERHTDITDSSVHMERNVR